MAFFGSGAIDPDFENLEIANRADVNLAQRGFLPPEKIRRVKLLGVVDSGATRLVLPQSAVKQLGLEPSGTIKVRYADRRQAVRPTVEDVQVELLGRQWLRGCVDVNTHDEGVADNGSDLADCIS